MNATCISTTGILSQIFSLLEISDFRIYSAADGEYMLETLEALGEIIKDEIQPVETISFDDFSTSSKDMEYGVADSPIPNFETRVADLTLLDREYKYNRTAIVQNPDPASKKGDYVLKVNSYVYPDDLNPVASTAMSQVFTMGISSVMGETYVLEADIYFKGDESVIVGDGTVAQITFGPYVFSLNVHYYTRRGEAYIKIGENHAGLDGVKDSSIADGIKTNEWVNLRVEYYKIFDNGLDVKGKIYVNGEYAGECDAGYVGVNGKFTNKEITEVKISTYRKSQFEFYLNNVLAEKCDKPFVSEEISDSDFVASDVVSDFEGYDSTDSTIHDKRYGDVLRPDTNVKNTLGDWYQNNEEDGYLFSGFDVVSDPKNAANKVLRAFNYWERVYDSNHRAIGQSSTNVAVAHVDDGGYYYFESDILVTNTEFGIEDIFAFGFYGENGKAIYTLKLNPTKGGSDMFIKNTVSNDKIFEGLKLGQWFKIGIELWYDGTAEGLCAKIYVNDRFVAQDKTGRALDTVVSNVCFTYSRTNVTEVYLDNIIARESAKDYEEIIYEGKTDFENHDFDDPFANDTITGDVTSPDDNVTNIIADKTLNETGDGYKWIGFDIAKSFYEAINKFMLVTVASDGKYVERASDASATNVLLTGRETDGNCYLFTADIFFTETVVNNDALVSVSFGDESVNYNNVRFYRNGGGNKIHLGRSKISDLIASEIASLGEWFELRVEIYDLGEGTAVFRYFINGVHLSDEIATYDGEFTVSIAKISYNRNRNGMRGIDNILFEKIEKAYSEDAGDVPYEPIGPETSVESDEPGDSDDPNDPEEGGSSEFNPELSGGDDSYGGKTDGEGWTEG